MASLGQAVDAVVAEVSPGEYRVDASPDPARIAALTSWLAARDLALADLRAGRQRLEDVFLRLTESAAAAQGAAPADDGPAAGVGGPADVGVAMKAYLGQTRAELTLSLRQGEQLLVSVAIPWLLLVFFSLVDVLPKPAAQNRHRLPGPGHPGPGRHVHGHGQPGHRHRLRAPVRGAQAAGRHPLGASPLDRGQADHGAGHRGRPGDHPGAHRAGAGLEPDGNVALVIPAYVLGTAAFAGIGLLMAGTLRGTITLAAANGLYIVLLLLGGMIIPLSSLDVLRGVAELLPPPALSQVMSAAFRSSVHVSAGDWVVLVAWAVLAPLAAARWFRWE